MARYIDADKFEQAIKGKEVFQGYFDNGFIYDELHRQPTADVVEVVRCENCAVPHNKWTGCPKLGGLVPPPDFYCAYGERRDT